jgi:hypothetical protein
MNHDSYERFGFTDPRDDFDDPELRYELFNEYNIQDLFLDKKEYSCLLLASNSLHHPVIQKHIRNKIELIYSAITNGMGLVIFHQPKPDDFISPFRNILVGAKFKEEPTIKAFRSKEHPILPDSEEESNVFLSIREDQIVPSYYLYYLCFEKLPEHFEGIAFNENHRFVLIVREYGRGRIVITTGAPDWYGANKRLIRSMVLWAAGSADVVVFPKLDGFISGIADIEHRIASKPADIGRPKILISVNSELDDIQAPFTISIKGEDVKVRSDGTLTKTRLARLLESTALADGSWENSVWKTAEAIDALNALSTGDHVSTIRRGLLFIRENIDKAQQPMVLANTLRALNHSEKMVDEEFRKEIGVMKQRLLPNDKILNQDIVIRIKVIRNLLGIRDAAELRKLVQTVNLDDSKLDNLSLDVASDILFITRHLELGEVADLVQEKIFRRLNEAAFTDMYVTLRFLENMIGLEIKEDILRTQILNTFSRILSGNRSPYLLSLAIKVFVRALEIPYYRNQILALDAVKMVIQGSLAVSVWPEIEPTLESIHKELHQYKERTDMFKSKNDEMAENIKKSEDEVKELKEKAEAVFIQITKRQATVLGGILAGGTLLVAVLQLAFGVFLK